MSLKTAEKIDESALDYEEKQFLYAEESRRELFGFRAENLAKHLEGWKLSTGDVYWPLIKGQLLAMTGELGKAEDILMDNLMRVRKQLMKKSHSPYLISVEESTVSLINFIRQSSYGEELEKCIHEGALSWWDENEKYYLNLKSEQPGRKGRQLSITLILLGVSQNTLALIIETYLLQWNTGVFLNRQVILFVLLM